MKKALLKIYIIYASLITMGCASIVSRSNYPISINSSPNESKIVIKDKKGIEIYAGQTPATINLKSGSGFFGKARYQVTFTKDGFETRTVPVEFKLDGWYFGNIVFGGVIGMLIVDPATGAMYKLKTEFLNVTLPTSTASIEKRQELRIYNLNEIPAEWKNLLVQINQ